jgi:hypothetical protein
MLGHKLFEDRIVGEIAQPLTLQAVSRFGQLPAGNQGERLFKSGSLILTSCGPALSQSNRTIRLPPTHQSIEITV